MPNYGSDTGNVLYLVACACPPAGDLPDLASQLQAAGWDVCVTATTAALDWIDVPKLETITGHPVRHRFRQPTETEDVPLGDGLLVAPASFNTINKWAAGVNDSVALGLLNEALGRNVPVWVVPWANDALRSHPAFDPNLDRLTSAGVVVVTADASDFAGSVVRRLPAPDSVDSTPTS